MKFIKCTDGSCIRTDAIIRLILSDYDIPANNWAVCASTYSERFCRLKICKDKINAQAWLDAFAAKLNEED